MSLYIFIPEHTFGVHVVENPNEIIKARVEFPKAFGPQAMCFSPVRSPSMPNEYTFKSLKQLPVGNIETVWSTVTSEDEIKFSRDLTHLYCTIPIQQVFWPVLGLSQMSSTSENRTSIGKWGRRP